MVTGVVLALFLAAAPVDRPPLPALPQSAEILLKVQRDGSLSVAEAVSVPDGTTLDRRVPLRTAAARHRDRVFGVRDVVLEGSGTAEVDEDAFTVHLAPGTSIVRYTVDGAVDGDRVTWEPAGGWSAELKLVRASFAAPKIPVAVGCRTGPPDADLPCGAAQVDHAGLTRFSQQNLAAGRRMTVTVELPAGTVPANARFVPSATLGGAFVLTTPVAWAWAGFGLLLLAAVVLVALARRRDANPGEPPAVELISGNGEFASPGGVLPGHVGPLLHARKAVLPRGNAAAADLAATVLDLAVRNYLWVSAEDGDWLLTRRNPPDEHLTAFERAVFEAVLPDGPVTLSRLRRRPVDAGRLSALLHAEAVRRGWLSRPPGERLGRLGRAGLRIVCYGLFLTVLLALTAGYAQLGVIVVLTGVTTVAGSAALPARRGAGADLARRLRGVARHLASARPAELGEEQRETVFSRGLPYALALGELGPWVTAFGGPERPPPVYWHDGAVTPDQAGSFATALAGTFAAARRGHLFGHAEEDVDSGARAAAPGTAAPS